MRSEQAGWEKIVRTIAAMASCAYLVTTESRFRMKCTRQRCHVACRILEFWRDDRHSPTRGIEIAIRARTSRTTSRRSCSRSLTHLYLQLEDAVLALRPHEPSTDIPVLTEFFLRQSRPDLDYP
jgi:hypothetical protein